MYTKVSTVLGRNRRIFTHLYIFVPLERELDLKHFISDNKPRFMKGEYFICNEFF